MNIQKKTGLNYDNLSTRFRVMMQIVQELCKRPGLNKTGFDMPTIFIPNMNKVMDL